MGSNLLKKAKKYQKERKWQQAIDVFEKYMSENNGACDADTYVSYAKCLRVVGHTSQAKRVLLEGKEQYPKSERILLESHNLYDSMGDWKSAEVVAKELIKMNPEQGDYYFRLGKTYTFLSDQERAEKAFKTGLKHKHKMSFENLVKKVQEGISGDNTSLKSQYIYLKGRNNLGAFIHEYDNRRYFTKICNYSKDAKREEVFYRDLRTDFPILKRLTPSYIDSQVLDGVLYLTIEMIEAVPTTLDHINTVIKVSQEISTIRYQDLFEEYSAPNYLFQFKKNRPVSVVHFFTQIHQRDYNQRLFSSLHKLIEQNNYSSKLVDAIQRLESLVMGNHLYAFIKPELHYSLLHGDFIPSNFKVKKKNELPQVFDWATFTIGPHFIDVAKYLTKILTTYPNVKRIYLNDKKIGGKLSLIEQIFFLYALILFYFQTLGEKRLKTRLSDFILPALKDMEVLVAEFKKEGYNDAVQALVEERKEKEKKQKRINQLRRRVRRLDKKNKELEKRHQDMLASKSWKITAPLRKIVQLKNKDK